MHATEYYVETFVEVARLKVDSIVAHHFVGRSGGQHSVLYKTRWTRLTGNSWEDGTDPWCFPGAILCYCTVK